MKSILAFFILILIILQSYISVGQKPYFETFDLEEEFPGIHINKLLLGKNSLLLVGTDKGLFQYDGQLLEQLPQRKQVQYDISSIFKDSKDLVYVGCKDGHILQVINDSLIPVVMDGRYPGVDITAITETNDGLLWISTYGEGLYYWDNHQLFNISSEDGLPDDYIYDIVADHQGNCWAGADQGLIRCQIEDGKAEIMTFGLDEGLTDLIIKSLAIDDQGQIWYGTYESGIGMIDPETLEIRVPESSNGWQYGSVETILAYKDLLWTGTPRHGIIEFDPEEDVIDVWTHDFKDNAFSRVSDIILDDQMNIWVASYNNLIRSNGRAFDFIKTKTNSNQSPTAVLYNNEGDLYIAYGNELWRQKYVKGKYLAAETIHLHNKANSIISLFRDEYGNVWIGTFGDGLIVYDPVSKNETLINESNGLTNGNILSINGNAQTIWLATLGGATCITIQSPNGIHQGSYSIEHYGEEQGIGNNFIYTVYIDSKDRVWFGTDGNGISVLEEGKARNIDLEDNFSGEVVYSITEDIMGNIWFSTARNGIFKIGETLSYFGLDEGLSSLDIRGIMADKTGRVLVVNESGLDVINIADSHLSFFNGYADISNSGINLNAMFIKGNIAFIGTGKGLVKVNTHYLPEKVRPVSIIRNFLIFLEPHSVNGYPELSHNQNYLTFKYSGIWFANPEKINYQIILEGHDLAWISTNNRIASYARLSPGNYTFRVRSSIDMNFVDADEASFSFTISKPYWQTAWFYILSGILIISLAVFIIKLRERNLKRIKDLEKEKIVFEFETLKSQVNPHFLFNSFSTLSSIIEENSDMAVEYVQRLSDFFRSILENRDKDLILLSEELLMINNYIEIQKSRFGEALVFSDNIPEKSKDSLIPPLVIQLLIENAIKHNVISSARPLNIHIDLSTDGKIMIKNNLQPKRKKEASTGLGLENIKQRYLLLARKEIDIIKTEEYFTVKLPII